MRQFYLNVRKALVQAGFKNREHLSRTVFQGRSKYISNAERRGQDISLSNAKSITSALGTSLERMLAPNPKSNEWDWFSAPDFREVIALHDQCQGNIQGLQSIIEYVDLFFPPGKSQTALVPYRVGNHSLASRILKRQGKAALNKAIGSWDNADLDARLQTSYAAALGGVKAVTIENFTEKFDVEPWQVETRYMRLLMQVHDSYGDRYVLNYSIELTSPNTSSATISRSSDEE